MFRKAVEIAVKAHKEQKDKSGVDYICHPLTVALKCETQEQKVVAVLHDVIEDSSVTLEELKTLNIFPVCVLEALGLLVHDKRIPYQEYIQRIADSGNVLAIFVKLKDIEDNTDPARMFLSEDEAQAKIRLEKYNLAYNKLYEVYKRIIGK